MPTVVGYKTHVFGYKTHVDGKRDEGRLKSLPSMTG
jgi:hypothetical protein